MHGGGGPLVSDRCGDRDAVDGQLAPRGIGGNRVGNGRRGAEGGYILLKPAMSPAESAVRCPMAIPSGIETIVGNPLIENAVEG